MEGQPPCVELSEAVKLALTGLMKPNQQLPHLDAYNCLECDFLCFGDAVRVEASCEHNFHHGCIVQALARDGTCCPCGEKLEAGSTKFKNAVCTRRMLNAVNVLCPQGCGAVMAFELLDAHVHGAQGCPNTPLRCGNEGCEELLKRSEMEDHTKGCSHRLRTCKLCEAKIKDRDMQEHVAGLCPQRTVSCSSCNKPYVCCNEKAHMRGCTGIPRTKDIVALREDIAALREDMQTEATKTEALRGEVGELKSIMDRVIDGQTDDERFVEIHRKLDLIMGQTSQRQQAAFKTAQRMAQVPVRVPRSRSPSVLQTIANFWISRK
eukprot:TRINITY_DN16195_c0_g1_i1.p1 TRINITY_DN16195_c0_g1~~TRINITY_DN16195_c0_g1_i1.p1  ORF type:complete len:321 (+),score=108.24 TRINITY_DN16195_c0_g1_i1:90-1052(+)